MDNRESIKRKIKALLAKTTENGATEEEAVNALKKAQSLMMENFISEHEITDPYLTEKCVFKEVNLIKSGYDVSIFYNSLSRLFDCEYYYNSKRIVFFGFEDDTELCAYFYNFIINSCLNEKERYLKSTNYQKLKALYHGRTLASSFIRGFQVGIINKMNEMYKNRTRDLSQEVGLMVISKKDKVKLQFEEQNKKIKTVKSRDAKYEVIAFDNGLNTAKDVSLNQGINDSKKESTLQIN